MEISSYTQENDLLILILIELIFKNHLIIQNSYFNKTKINFNNLTLLYENNFCK